MTILFSKCIDSKRRTSCKWKQCNKCQWLTQRMALEKPNQVSTQSEVWKTCRLNAELTDCLAPLNRMTRCAPGFLREHTSTSEWLTFFIISSPAKGACNQINDAEKQHVDGRRHWTRWLPVSCRATESTCFFKSTNKYFKWSLSNIIIHHYISVNYNDKIYTNWILKK